MRAGDGFCYRPHLPTMYVVVSRWNQCTQHGDHVHGCAWNEILKAGIRRVLVSQFDQSAHNACHANAKDPHIRCKLMCLVPQGVCLFFSGWNLVCITIAWKSCLAFWSDWGRHGRKNNAKPSNQVYFILGKGGCIETQERLLSSNKSWMISPDWTNLF